MEREFESMKWLAEKVGISLPTAYRLAEQQVIPPGVVVRLGRRLRVHVARADAWLAYGGGGFDGGWKHSAGDSVSGSPK